jgi:hypothetical protein
MAEWYQVIIPTEQKAGCAIGPHPPFDGAAMPNTLSELGISGTNGTVEFWTKDPHPQFPGTITVFKLFYYYPTGSSNYLWLDERWDEVASKSLFYRCVK